MTKRNLFFFCLLLLGSLLLAACGSEEEQAPAVEQDTLAADTTPKTVEITPEGGPVLQAAYYPRPGTAQAPALLLVHGLKEDRTAWRSFAETAQAEGYAVLALDLRGHGQSEGYAVDVPLMNEDVTAALLWLLNRPEIDRQRIGGVGARVGANLLLQVAAQRPDISSLVLLSPLEAHGEVPAQESLARYGRRPVLIVASEGDPYTIDPARTLYRQALGHSRLQTYPGTARGTEILRQQAGLTPIVLTWLDTTL